MREKRVPRKYLFLRLWRYLSRYYVLIGAGGILMLLSNVLALLGPKLSGKAIDAIGIRAGGVDFEKVFYYVGWMAVFYVFSAFFSYLLSLLTIRLTRKVIYQMRRDVFEKLSRLPVSFFDRYQTGDIISIITYDIDTVNQSLSNDLLQIMQSVITVLFSLVMMLSIAPVMVLIFVITIPISVLLTRFITSRSRPLYRIRSKKLGELNGFVEEMLNGQKTTRAYGREEQVIDAFDRKNGEAVETNTKAEYYGTLAGPSVNFMNNTSLALISVFGSLLYLRGGIGIGDISSFVQYSRKFSGPINETANIIGELQSAFAAAERVFRLMDELPEKPDEESARILQEVYGEVEIRDVSFGYTAGEQILKDFNLHARGGEQIAIVGPTGAGKTTVINLLMRFYDVDKGCILLDGEDTYRITRDSLRSAYTMVLQDAWLFHGTIYENLTYGRENITRKEVEQAAKAAMIYSYIEKLPEGFETVLSDNGVHISKGQRQLLTIARAMLSDAHMLILDEATSNVDTRTEMQIQKAMRSLMADKTCFVIAHRLSTIRNADLILVVKDGRIAEQGNHRELLARRGLYYQMYHAQFEGAEQPL
ncbi:MAG: ABC transporter ATP-binding protein [Lachnospiraceae bacterium]|jgi:ATP-binding cassette subfamily B protein|nr:ABC transporter ATP-binding protein [Lachnospiraceae bacterium]MCI9096635.1 ABC transporter ATP-binding protein [Lachnospiraceae bacterium]